MTLPENVACPTRPRGLTPSVTARGIRRIDIGPIVPIALLVMLSIRSARKRPDDERNDDKSAECEEQ